MPEGGDEPRRLRAPGRQPAGQTGDRPRMDHRVEAPSFLARDRGSSAERIPGNKERPAPAVHDVAVGSDDPGGRGNDPVRRCRGDVDGRLVPLIPGARIRDACRSVDTKLVLPQAVGHTRVAMGGAAPVRSGLDRHAAVLVARDPEYLGAPGEGDGGLALHGEAQHGGDRSRGDGSLSRGDRTERLARGEQALVPLRRVAFEVPIDLEPQVAMPSLALHRAGRALDTLEVLEDRVHPEQAVSGHEVVKRLRRKPGVGRRSGEALEDAREGQGAPDHDLVRLTGRVVGVDEAEVELALVVEAGAHHRRGRRIEQIDRVAPPREFQSQTAPHDARSKHGDIRGAAVVAPGGLLS